MLNNEYRVHGMAKNFKKNSEEVADILTKYATAPKNHVQVLESRELSLIFEYLTQHNQMDNIKNTYAEVYRESKATPTPREGPAKAAPQAQKPATPAGRPAPRQPQSKPQSAQQPANRPTTHVPEEEVVNTRRGGRVSLEKYDERLESLAAGKAEQVQAGKQRFQGHNRRKGGFQGSERRREEQEKMRRLQLKIAKKTPLAVKIPDAISVDELASRMKEAGAEMVRTLVKNGVMTSLSDVIDFDTAAIIAEELGYKAEKEVIITIEEWPIGTAEDKGEDLEPRAPVVVVMGHVGHGKTSLLDYIRNTHVAVGEAGSIAQHIGAYQVNMQGKTTTFLDIPGHEVFTTTRACDTIIIDAAILVVAADDDIMPQTVKPISRAKTANIPIIVAIDKMDKPEVNPEHIRGQLIKYELVPEEWGGETVICLISARTGEDTGSLLEMVNLTAEMQELEASPNRSAHDAVIETRLDKGCGPVATLLVWNDTLKQGNMIIAGTAVGRVRAMTSAKGEKPTEAGSSVSVKIIGMGEVPSAGDDFHAVADERMARELVEQRKHEQKMATSAPVGKMSLEDLFGQIKQGEVKDLNTIVKAGVQGSAEAIKTNLGKLFSEEVRVRVIHCAMGAISESNIMLATTSSAIIVGLNARPDNNVKESAARNNVDIRICRVIYDYINEIETAMKDMLAPKFKEVELDQAGMRNVFRVTGVGMVTGCYITNDRMQHGAQMRLPQDDIIIYDGAVASLQCFKDNVEEIAQGYECGTTFEKFRDIREGDVIGAYLMEQIEV